MSRKVPAPPFKSARKKSALLEPTPPQDESRESPPGTPRWVKVFGIVLVLILLLVVLLLVSGGNHGPGRHAAVIALPVSTTATGAAWVRGQG